MKTLLIALLLPLAVPAFAQFGIGDSVAVVNVTDCINARSAPAIPSNVLECEIAGMHGLVKAGPVTASGYTWWQVAYRDGVTGWSNGAALAKITSLTPPPPVTGTCNYDSAKNSGIAIGWALAAAKFDSVFTAGVASAKGGTVFVNADSVSVILQGWWNGDTTSAVVRFHKPR